MKVEFKDLEFDEDFSSKTAEEMGLFQLKLDLPKGLFVTGWDAKNKIMIRRLPEELKKDQEDA